MTRSTTPRAQLDLAVPAPPPTWGGKRKNAGRKKAPRSEYSVPHVRRAFHAASHPVHVTVRVRRKIGSLRRHHVAAAVGQRLRVAATAAHLAGRRRTFRVVHFSIQPTHVHLIVEAGSAQSLARGLQGLLAHVARRVNTKLERHGKLWAERYHARELATPLEVRRAIAYVLTNAAKHPEPFADLGTNVIDGLDPCSSARWFGGWRRPPPPESLPPPVARPLTWLLGTGWKRHGLLRRDEQPAS